MRKVKKLTPSLLKNIIAEEQLKIKHYPVTAEEFAEKPEDSNVDVEAKENAWAGGDNLVNKVDHLNELLKKLQVKKLKEVKKILEIKKRLDKIRRRNK